MAFMNGLNGNLISLGLNSSNPNYDGGINDFANQVLNLHKDKIRRENQINDAMLQHQLQPINLSAAPYTTNNLVSHGLTGANTDINTVASGNQINPLDLAKLKQGQEKIDVGKEKNQNELGFKYSKESTDSNIRQQRADVYDYRTKHPDHKFDFSGATVKVADPSSGQVYDTGLSTDKLSMEDKLNLMNKNDVMQDTNRLNITGMNNLNRDTAASQNRLGEIKARGNETRETNAVKPNTALVSNSQVNQGYINTASELLNTHPEYAPYIKLGKSDNGKVNGFSVNPVNGEGDPLYHEINSKIYGSGMGDVSIPSGDSSKNKDNKSNDSKKSDPLGIR
jgi:hypothetical protein